MVFDIFSRLYQVTRANINSRRKGRDDAPPYDEDGFWQDRKGAAGDREGSHGGSHDRSEQQRSSPPGQDPKLAEYYAALEVPYGSDLEAVRVAWKKMMRAYHPDRHANDPEKQRLADQLAQEINQAYRELERFLKAGGRP